MERATRKQTVDVVLNRRPLPLLGHLPLVLLAMLGTLDSANLRARAGVLKPLLQLLQPSVENRLADQCRSLAAQAIDREWVSEALVRQAVEQPCRSLARPVSECLIRETSRSGREWGVLTELLRGQIGDDSDVVIKRCLATLLGLSSSDLETIPVQEFVDRLRQ